MAVLRLLLLPFKLVLALVGAAFRGGVYAGKAPMRFSWRLARLAGPRGWFCFFLGLAIGLLFAPGPGRELRARLQALLAPDGVSDEELAAKVGFELAHAPRTWHLSQPEVRVTAGRVRLSGTVVTDDERDELARVAAAIPGVQGVDNALDLDRATDGGAEASRPGE
jgi:hypothetical protein